MHHANSVTHVALPCSAQGHLDAEGHDRESRGLLGVVVDISLVVGALCLVRCIACQPARSAHRGYGAVEHASPPASPRRDAEVWAANEASAHRAWDSTRAGL